jgi:hypothetical protein
MTIIYNICIIYKMPNYKRSKSQKKNGGSRSLRRSRSAKRGGRRATKSSRGGQRAKKNVMQRGGGDMVTYDELKTELENTPNKSGAYEFITTMGAKSFDDFKETAQKVVGQETSVNIKKIKDNFFDKEDKDVNARLALLTLLSK